MEDSPDHGDNEGKGKSMSNSSNKVTKLVIKCNVKKIKSDDDVDLISRVVEHGESSTTRDMLGFEKRKKTNYVDPRLTLYSHVESSSRSEMKIGSVDQKSSESSKQLNFSSTKREWAYNELSTIEKRRMNDMKKGPGKSTKGFNSSLNSSSRSKKRNRSYNQLGLGCPSRKANNVDHQTLESGFTSTVEKQKVKKMKIGNITDERLKLELGFKEEWFWVALIDEEIDADIYEVKRKILVKKQEEERIELERKMLLKKQKKERIERMKRNKRRALIRLPVNEIEADISIFMPKRYRRKPDKRTKNCKYLDHIFPGQHLVGLSLIKVCCNK